jgi:hypothetical protein
MFDGVVGREEVVKLDRAQAMFGPTLSVEIERDLPHSTTKASRVAWIGGLSTQKPDSYFSVQRIVNKIEIYADGGAKDDRGPRIIKSKIMYGTE